MKTTDVLVIMKSLEKQAKPSIAKVSDLTIKSQSDFELAGKLLGEVKELAKQAKAKEETFTVPLNKLLKDTRELFKPFRDLVNKVEIDTKGKMLEFIESNKKEALKLEQQFADGKIKKVSTVVEKINALDTTSQFSQLRKVWTAFEVDGSQTPREFLVPDTQAIREALKAGRKVKGWEWKQVEQIAI